jgi:hypothetical protein
MGDMNEQVNFLRKSQNNKTPSLPPPPKQVPVVVQPKV